MNNEILERVWRLDAPRVRSQLARKHGIEAAEDIVAEAITELAEWGRDVGYEDARRVFGRIALRGATDAARRASTDDVQFVGEHAISQDVFMSIDTALLRADLSAAIRSLPATEREAFTLTELRGLTVREAGSVLGVGKDTVARRAEAARTLLQQELS